MEDFRRDLFIDMVVDRFNFKNNKVRSPLLPLYSVKQVWVYLKQGYEVLLCSG